MTHKILIALALQLAVAPVYGQVSEALISRAVLPLPEALRADAAVFTYDESGTRQNLRSGTNAVECKIKDQNNHTLCFAKSTAARRDYSAKLAASGLEGDELRAAEAKAEAAGLIQPVPPGSMIYRLDESEGGMQLLWVVMLPNTNSSELAVSPAGRFTSSVKGMGTPWMMREGTSSAHIMMPINGTDLSNKGGAETALDTSDIHPFIRATLPLPRDLRRETTVVSYDTESGERKILRRGSNGIVCVPRDEETGFTRCSHEKNLAELDLRMKMHAEGQSDEAIDAAIQARIASGDIPTRRFGEFLYRLYEGEEDRLKLLWVIRLPGVTAAETGMPTHADRDKLSIGKGTPWLMREGTDRAHLMIPVNGTELSNMY
ncbi:MAG: hypothetical protein ACR2Q3_13155 [Woeseiaceae bacterium]